jgi:hypothetical protein
MYTTKGPTSENAKDRDKNHMEALRKKFPKEKYFWNYMVIQWLNKIYI